MYTFAYLTGITYRIISSIFTDNHIDKKKKKKHSYNAYSLYRIPKHLNTDRKKMHFYFKSQVRISSPEIVSKLFHIQN